MRIPLLEGEACRRQPFAAPRIGMVNRAFVTRYLASRPSPLGLHLTLDSPGRSVRIVGVVGDAREVGLDRAPVPTLYTCFSAPNPTPLFLVRTRGEPLDLAQTVRLKMRDIEPLRSVYDIAALEERIDSAFAQNRLRTALLTFFAVTALALACVGLYGTLSSTVTERRREIALRLAVGARRRGVVRQFVQQGLRVAVVASVCGLALSAAFTQLLRGMLFEVSPLDPMVVTAVITLVLVVAAGAALIPAIRAGLVEPMQALREG